MKIIRQLSLQKSLFVSFLILSLSLVILVFWGLYQNQKDLYIYLRSEVHKNVSDNWQPIETTFFDTYSIETRFYEAFKKSRAQNVTQVIGPHIVSLKKNDGQIYFKAEPLGFLEFYNTSFLKTILYTFGILLLVSLFIYVLLKRILRPIQQVRKVLEDVSAGKYDIDINYNSQDDLSRIIQVVKDLSTRLNKSSQEASQMSELATKDGMTGLYNYRYFQTQFTSFAKSAVQNKQDLGVVMLDVDHFKKFNDTYGHQQGDEVLKTVAKTLKGQGLDLIARYGGEEFIMLIQNMTVNALFDVTEKLRIALESTQVIKLDSPSETLKVTASFGGFVIPYKTINAVDLKSYIEICDKNLYASKKKGRNCVTVS